MVTKTSDYFESLLINPEPVIRLKTIRNILGKSSQSPEIQKANKDLNHSTIVHRLLIDQKSGGRNPYHPYNKWFGAHWVLSILADLGYPEGDLSLKPILDQCYEWLLSKEHQEHIRLINGRIRRCASQEGNCLFYSFTLGLADDRSQELADRLIKWQWEDGGWNCDKRPEVVNSSFNESLIPLRGLALYSKTTGDPKAKGAVERAVDVFLKRHLFRRIRDGLIIDRNFVKLHYPCYWHYDVLFALKVLTEAGYITDPRCANGLDLLESKQLSDGGFPAEERYYRVDEKKLSGHSRVDWGGISKVHSSPFVSVDALYVLKESGRFTR